MQNDHSSISRRTALRSAAAGLMILKPNTVFGTQANSAIELGLIGCGSRGGWMANIAVKGGARFVALADAFQDRLDVQREKLGVGPSRAYLGLQGYRELVAVKLDGVLIECPPYFHPEMAAAAVGAGKHVYIAKPVAVDVPGCLSIQATGEKAKGKLSFLVDFQIPSRPTFQEAVSRVHRGDIGVPILGDIFYHADHMSNIHPIPGAPPDVVRLRIWMWDRALSGDVIVERDIHVLDLANWYFKAHPLKAYGTGGRKANVNEIGDNWNHFLVTYWYPDDLKANFSSAEFTRGYRELGVRVLGTMGGADTRYNGPVSIIGKNAWKGTDWDDTHAGEIVNMNNWLESIRTGKYLNNVPVAVESNLTAILGRMAAYQNRVVTWAEMLQNREKYEANLKL